MFAWFCAVVLRGRDPERQAALVRRLALGAGLLTLGIYVALNVSALRCFLLQNDEADILAIAAASLHGQPVYHALNSAEFGYSLRYGPVTFLLYRALLVMGGERFWVLRAAVLAANLLVCLSFYGILRKTVRRAAALAVMALPLGALMEQMRYALGMRADIWIVLVVALGMRAAMMESGVWAGLVAGVCLGLAIDLKVTAVVAAVLVVVLLYQRHGVKPAMMAAGVTAVTAFEPFALQGFSLTNYVAWLHSAPGGLTLISHDLILSALAYAALLIAPLVMLRRLGGVPLPAERGWGAVAHWVVIAGAVLAVASVAAKPGTGTWHFWQLIPVMVGYVALALGEPGMRCGRRMEYAVLALALGGMMIGLSFVRRDVSMVQVAAAQKRELVAGRTELDAYMDGYRGRTVQVGYGEWQGVGEWLRYIPVLRGQPYTLDGSLRLEEFFERFPHDVIAKMDDCTNDVWLIPHDEPPFIFGYVFPPELHEVFVTHYAVERQGAELDAWVCKAL
jgi:hypothetical protein